MKLSLKTYLIVGSVLFFSIGANWIVLRASVLPSFEQLETEAVTRDVNRAYARVLTEGQALLTAASDWSVWDETYNYALGTNDQYAENNFYDDAWSTLDVEFAYFIRQDGTIAFGVVYQDLENGIKTQLTEFDQAVKARTHPILTPLNTSEGAIGVIETEFGRILVATSPIVRNDGSGPVAGIVAFGRLLTEERVDALRAETGVDFAISKYEPHEWEVRKTEMQVLSDKILIDSPGKAEARIGMAKFIGLSGNPELLITSRTPSDITLLGNNTVWASLAALALVGLATILVVALGLNRAIVAPLKSLASTMDHVARTGELSHQTGMKREDEIGIVSKSFDQMLSDLREARQRLLDQSFYAGQADQAAGALHNIRNAMNPLGVGMWKLRQLMKEPLDEKLAKAATLVSDQDAANEKLVAYLRDLSAKMSRERAAFADEANILVSQSRELEKIVEDSLIAAPSTTYVDCVDLSMVLAEVREAATSRAGMDISLRIEPTDVEVSANRTILSQIVSNLLTNARESIEACNRPAGTISVKTETVTEGKNAFAVVHFVDDGEGFDQGDHKRLFGRGYSTRKEKSGGLGLHWCANSVHAMGGRIESQSDGPGQGACFSLFLPVHPKSDTSRAA